MNIGYKCSVFLLSVKVLSILSFFLLVGCDQSQEKSTEKNIYYDLKGFIETQITILSKQKPTVDKVMTVSGKNESRATREVDWKKELELFVQADINKPAYSKSYAISKPDSLTTVYTLKTEENIPVKSVMIQMDKTTGYPAMVKAVLRSENKLYQSEKNIELHCNGSTDQTRLTSYSIKGYQKLATMNKKDFDIKARVKY